MNTQTEKSPLTQEELRSLCWDMGTRYPSSFKFDGIAFLAVYPHQGFIQWHVNADTSHSALDKAGMLNQPGRLVIRVYDVTDIEFNGFNAHLQFDIEIGNLAGNYYLKVDRFERTLLAEIGLRCHDGRFVPYARSNVIYFDRSRRSHRRDLVSLFVSRTGKNVVPVSQPASAPIFEQMVRAVGAAGEPHAAVFVNETQGSDAVRPVTEFVKRVLDKCESLGQRAELFAPGKSGDPEHAAAKLIERFRAAHRKRPFSCVESHDLAALAAAVEAAQEIRAPHIHVMHHADQLNADRVPDAAEREAVSHVRCLVVPSEAAAGRAAAYFGIDRGRVAVIPDDLPAAPGRQTVSGSAATRQWCGLGEGRPVGLFAGEIAHHSGADMLVDVLPGICGEFGAAQFIIAGEGPLKGELEYRIRSAGIGHRCRFVGDVAADLFAQIVALCDFVVIPGRTQQDSGLVQLAFGAGKPVVATHQSRVQGITHGVNGYLVYDNPGSIVWGLKEIIGNPPGMHAALGLGAGAAAIECIAARYVTQWALAATEHTHG